MGDVQGSSVKGINYRRRKLSGCNFLGAIFLSENCPGSNCPGVIVRRAIMLGSNCPGGNCPR